MTTSLPLPRRLQIHTANGHAIVTNYACHSSDIGPNGIDPNATRPELHTGKVWAEVQCGMAVNRISLTRAETRAFASMLVEMADKMEDDMAGKMEDEETETPDEEKRANVAERLLSLTEENERLRGKLEKEKRASTSLRRKLAQVWKIVED